MYRGNTPPTPGMRVLCRSAEWLVTGVDAFDSANEDRFQHYAIHCTGMDDLVRGHPSIFLTQLDDIDPVDPTGMELVQDESNGYKLSRLFLEANLRQMPATGIAPDLSGMGVFDPFAFQVEAVKRALRQLRPRLLLADAVGLGKTIQVGMILTELIRRGRANRILVLAKKSMLTQFQAELWNRFNIPLVRMDSEGIARLRLRIPGNKNPFEVFHRVIISIDTLKNVARYEHFLKDSRWDVVIIDEAHNVAGASVPERHLSNRLARLLSRRTDSMLLTTATPHNGRRETFGRLISLLDPSTIPDPKFKEYSAEDIQDFFLMRFKEDIRSEAGDMLSDRQLIPLARTSADATDAEEAVYRLLAGLRELSRKRREASNPDEARAKHTALLQYGFYKLFLSSPEACDQTVARRLDKLTEHAATVDEIALLKPLSKALGKLTIRDSTRYGILKRELESIGWDGSPKSPRVLVFTEYRRTQDALTKALARDFRLDHSEKFEAQPNQAIAVIHGGTPDTHLMKTVEAFATGSAPIRIMIATDVVSEGINLHHECHHIVHYDLPWSIITLIQRNGRIDRLGQKKSPVLRYLIVNTAEGLLKGDQAIFERLVEKVETINRLRQSGESVLKLYDPKAEEEYIARQGILAGNVAVLDAPAAGETDAAVTEAAALEKLLAEANHAGHEDFLNFLLGEDQDDAKVAASPATTTMESGSERFRLYSARRFLVEGYTLLAESNPGYLPLQVTDKTVTVTAPPDLKRRLGKAGVREEVIFGATAIPVESWPENDQFRLTDDPQRVNLAIQAARNCSGYWSQELLCSEQNPILQWLTERLLMTMARNQAPIILSRHLEPGELCFCFVGQVSSKSGIPLIVDGHAISYLYGGKFKNEKPLTRPLKEALSIARFDSLMNSGDKSNLTAARLLLHGAVKFSIEHMQTLRFRRERQMKPLLEKEEARLYQWRDRREALLKQRIAESGEHSQKAKELQKQIQEINDYVVDRSKHWRDAHFTAADHPSTRLIIVIQGAS